MKYLFHISPIAASRPRVSKWGTYYSGPYKRFKSSFALLVNKMFPPGTTPLHTPLDVKIECIVCRPKSTKLSFPKPDVDNLAKAVMDGLNNHLWKDDSQVIDLRVTKRWAKEGQIGYIAIDVKEKKLG